jgi:hypothetical protein
MLLANNKFVVFLDLIVTILTYCYFLHYLLISNAKNNNKLKWLLSIIGLSLKTYLLLEKEQRKNYVLTMIPLIIYYIYEKAPYLLFYIYFNILVIFFLFGYFLLRFLTPYNYYLF